MTAPAPDTLEREREKLYVTDAELIRRIGVPERTARQMLRDLDADSKSGFPPKQELFGHRRYWGAVEKWLAEQAERRSPAAEPTELIGRVYFLASRSHIKIGFSAAGVRKRIHTIRASHYEKLEVLTIIRDAPKRAESGLHKKFAAFRVRGEWFWRVSDIEDFARTHNHVPWDEDFLS